MDNKPIPCVCGSLPTVTVMAYTPPFRVRCETCQKSISSDTEIAAIERWNRQQHMTCGTCRHYAEDGAVNGYGTSITKLGGASCLIPLPLSATGRQWITKQKTGCEYWSPPTSGDSQT